MSMTHPASTTQPKRWVGGKSESNDEQKTAQRIRRDQAKEAAHQEKVKIASRNR
jgi:hypothetical protein